MDPASGAALWDHATPSSTSRHMRGRDVCPQERSWVGAGGAGPHWAEPGSPRGTWRTAPRPWTPRGPGRERSTVLGCDTPRPAQSRVSVLGEEHSTSERVGSRTMSGFASEGVTLRRGSLRAPVTRGPWRLSLCGHGRLCPEGFSSRSRWWRSGASGVQGVPALGSPPVLFPGAKGKARPAAGVCRHRGGGAVLLGGAATRRPGAEAPSPCSVRLPERGSPTTRARG